jgi:F0F1-type ATP synthase membrane subunit b/b'
MEINFTLFIQAAIYLALFVVLKNLYFHPLLALLKKRDQLTTGKLDEVATLSKKIETLTAQYEAKMKQTKESMEAHRQETLQKVRASAEEKIHDAKTKLEKKLSDYQATLERDAQHIRSKFPTLSAEIKKDITDAILTSRVVKA